MLPNTEIATFVFFCLFVFVFSFTLLYFLGFRSFSSPGSYQGHGHICQAYVLHKVTKSDIFQIFNIYVSFIKFKMAPKILILLKNINWQSKCPLVFSHLASFVVLFVQISITYMFMFQKLLNRIQFGHFCHSIKSSNCLIVRNYSGL